MYLNEKIGKVTIKWNGGSLTTSRKRQFLQELVVGYSIFVFRRRICIRDPS